MWITIRQIPGELKGGDSSKIRIPVQLEIPSDQPENSLEENVEWVLKLRDRRRKRRIIAQFKVPVFSPRGRRSD